jgi:hypothetical protein
MAANKRITNLDEYSSVLPYASELFGIYQPLLGWKSKRIKERQNKGLVKDKRRVLDILNTLFETHVDVQYGKECQLKNIDLKAGDLLTGTIKTFDSILLTKIASGLPAYKDYKSEVWRTLLAPKSIDKLFKEFVEPYYKSMYEKACRDNSINKTRVAKKGKLQLSAFEKKLKYESALAGSLQYLLETGNDQMLVEIFYSVKDNRAKAEQLMRVLSQGDAQEAYLDLNSLDPSNKEHLKNVSLSPIGVVHLFRQYFFELDTFLGTPVGHVWLSPGASAELIEVSTRKTIIERSLETTLESVAKSETDATGQDEISEAVKEDNKKDIKFGASVSASYGTVEAKSSFDLADSQQTSREETHKRMRQQTEKLSSEIRKNVKSTFKTVTETTDTSSKRYVLANNTGELINYEMRRKMRQVSVQVQDIGTYLCWQTYVDDPGKDLGVAQLLHIAKSPELDSIVPSEMIPLLPPVMEQKAISIPLQQAPGSSSLDSDDTYKDGVEIDTEIFDDAREKIIADFSFVFTAPQSGYTLANVEYDTTGSVVTLDDNGITQEGSVATVKVHLSFANFQGRKSMDIQANLTWIPDPTMNAGIEEQNIANMANFDAQTEAANRKAYVESAKERIKLASGIRGRKSEDLREEERIVVYRKLIQDMLSNGVVDDNTDDRTRHVVAELINSIFDVDKMLYFVAPDWWRPRMRTTQRITMEGETADLSSTSVGWGGIGEANRDNYYITEESEPAKLGSSLGWLLQLDGDNMRNAFLNAPWVKSVIPIRPGKEEAAINWLKGVEGFNGIGDTDLYHTDNANEKDLNGNPLNGQKLIDVLYDLAAKIKLKHEEGIRMGQFPNRGDISNPELVDEGSVVTSTPIDRVYEHGFYPLKDSFRANVNGNYEIFDQWIEVLPTDQVVPVEVKYNPITGRQIL